MNKERTLQKHIVNQARDRVRRQQRSELQANCKAIRRPQENRTLRARNSCGHSLCGFSLIELSIVLSLIAIVLAVLFPAFANAREKGRFSACQNNLRSIGIALQMYAQDYDEVYPKTQYNFDASWKTKGNMFGWYRVIWPYIKSGNKTEGGFSDGGGGVWHCPTVVANQSRNYGLSSLFGSGPAPWLDARWQITGTAPIARAEIETPAEKVIVVEKGLEVETSRPDATQMKDYAQPLFCAEEWCWTPWKDAPLEEQFDWQSDCDTMEKEWPYCSAMPRYRHNHTCNMLFADGHVRAMLLRDVSWKKHIFIDAGYLKNETWYPY